MFGFKLITASTRRQSRFGWMAALMLFASPAADPSSIQSDQVPRTGRDLYGPFEVVGVASCATASCHGGLNPNHQEFRIWFERDRHSRAFATLESDQSREIARRLEIPSAPAATECLTCHAPVALRADEPRREVLAREGVSCETCHGAAGKWLEPHKRSSWMNQNPQEKLANFGLTDTKAIGERAKLCVECHVGGDSRDVTHRMIAAGHPELVFELDLFSTLLPPHWRAVPGNRRKNSAHLWAVGQVASLDQALALLRLRLQNREWPEFAAFECSACHHALRDPAWRQRRDPFGRSAGSLQWQINNWLLIDRFAGDHSPSNDYRETIKRLARLLATPATAKEDLDRVLTDAGRASKDLFARVAAQELDVAHVRAIITEVSTKLDADHLDPRRAMYIVMGITALVETVFDDGVGDSERSASTTRQLRATLNRLLDSTMRSDFAPDSFVRELREWHDQVYSSLR